MSRVRISAAPGQPAEQKPIHDKLPFPVFGGCHAYMALEDLRKIVRVLVPDQFGYMVSLSCLSINSFIEYWMKLLIHEMRISVRY